MGTLRFFGIFALMALFWSGPGECRLEAQTKGSKADELVDSAMKELAAGKVDEARKLFTAATQADPNNARAWQSLGKLAALQGKRDEAITAFSKAWAAKDVFSLKALGMILLGNDQAEQFKPLIPDVIGNTNKEPELRSVLLIYVLKYEPENQDLLKQAVDGVKQEELEKMADTSLYNFIAAYDRLRRDQELIQVENILKKRVDRKK